VTSQQENRIRELQSELTKRGDTSLITWSESNSAESKGVLFGEVKGVTVTVSPGGLMNIPAVRTYHPPEYPTPVLAAADADNLWARQEVLDSARPDTARKRRTGHLGRIVDPNLKCRNKDCPCNCQSPEDRQKRAQGGFNTNPDRCS